MTATASPSVPASDSHDSGSAGDEQSAVSPAGDASPFTEELILEAGRASRHYWADLWRYRELFYILAWRDVSVRYKQTVLGVTWALIQPVLTMVIMTVVFGYVAKLPTEGDAPYAILVFAGMLPWQFFATALAAASQSLVGNANLISKVYFPRLIIPASSVLTSFVDFLISFSVLVVMMAWYRFMPTWQILALPLLMLLAFLAAMGPGLLMTALNVKYRDFRYVIPFLIQFGLYASPVGFSSSVIRDRFGETGYAIYSLNPMVGIIDGFRWAILGTADFHLTGFAISCSVIAAFLLAGIWYFRRTEQSFADVI